MAILNFTGFESGSFTEVLASVGNVSFSTSVTRSAKRSLFVDPAASSGATAYVSLGVFIADGTQNTFNINSTACQFWFRIGTMPTQEEAVFGVYNTALAQTRVKLAVTPTGTLKLYLNGATQYTSTVALSAGVWYQIGVTHFTNGNLSLYVNGTVLYSTPQGGPGSAQGDLRFGLFENSGFTPSGDYYYDDVVLDDVSLPIYDVEVHQFRPVGNGYYTGYSASTGAKFDCVGESPPDNFSTYIEDTSGTFAAYTSTFEKVWQNASLLGVKALMTWRDPSGTGSQATVRVRYGGTDYQPTSLATAAATPVTVGYVLQSGLTLDKFNAIEAGPYSTTRARVDSVQVSAAVMVQPLRVQNFVTFQTGDTRECAGAVGTYTVESTGTNPVIRRLRCNPSTSGGTGYVKIAGLTAAGLSRPLNTGGTLGIQFGIAFSALPTQEVTFLVVKDVLGATKISLCLNPQRYVVVRDRFGTALYVYEVRVVTEATTPGIVLNWVFNVTSGTSGSWSFQTAPPPAYIGYFCSGSADTGAENFGEVWIGAVAITGAVSPNVVVDNVMVSDTSQFLSLSSNLAYQMYRLGGNGTDTGFVSSNASAKYLNLQDVPTDGSGYISTAGPPEAYTGSLNSLDFSTTNVQVLALKVFAVFRGNGSVAARVRLPDPVTGTIKVNDSASSTVSLGSFDHVVQPMLYGNRGIAGNGYSIGQSTSQVGVVCSSGSVDCDGVYALNVYDANAGATAVYNFVDIIYFASGKLRFSGQVLREYVAVPVGKLTLGGLAVVRGALAVRAAGALVFSGQVGFAPTFLVVGTGRLVVSGVASLGGRFDMTGGLRFSGVAVVRYGYRTMATGPLRLSGVYLGQPAAPSGKLVVSGVAEVMLGVAGTPTASVVNFSGFESAGLEEALAFGGNISILADVTRSPGAYVLKAKPIGSGLAWVSFGRQLPDGRHGPASVAVSYVRFYLRIDETRSGLNTDEVVFEARDGFGTTKVSVRLSTNVLTLYGADDLPVGTDPTTLATGSWHRVDLVIGTGTDYCLMAVEGSVAPVTGTVYQGEYPAATYYLGKSRDTNSTGYAVSFDDFMASADPVPSGTSVLLRVVADGDADSWLPNPIQQQWLCVDEYLNNQDSEYIYTLTPDDTQSFAHQNPAGVGVTGFGINAVKVLAVVNEYPGGLGVLGGGGSSGEPPTEGGEDSPPTTGNALTLRIASGAAVAATQPCVLTGREVLGLVTTADPATGGEWSISALTTAQSGVKAGQPLDNGVRCDALMVLVDFTPLDVVAGVAGGRLRLLGAATVQGHLAYEASGRIQFLGTRATSGYGFYHVPTGGLLVSGTLLTGFVAQGGGRLSVSGLADYTQTSSAWQYEGRGRLRLSGHSGFRDRAQGIFHIGDGIGQTLFLANDPANGLVGFGGKADQTTGGPVVITDGVTPALDEWYLVSLQRDAAGNVILTVNGEQIDSLPGGAAPSYGTAPVVWAAQSLDGFFSGKLDDIRVYGRSLSLAEIRRLYAGDDYMNASIEFVPAYEYEGRGRLRVANQNLGTYWFDAGGRLGVSGRAGVSGSATTNDVMRPVFVVGGDQDQQALVVANTWNGLTGFALVSANRSAPPSSVASGVLPQAGAWYHLAMVRDGVSVRLYVDGQQVASVPVTGPATFGTNPKAWLARLLGSRLAGQVDDARFYLQPLTAEQVASLAGLDDLSTASFSYTAAFTYVPTGRLRLTGSTLTPAAGFTHGAVGRLLWLGGIRSTAAFLSYRGSGALSLRGSVPLRSAVDNVSFDAGPLVLGGTVPLQSAVRYRPAGRLVFTGVTPPFVQILRYEAGGRLAVRGQVGLYFPSYFEGSGALGSSRVQELRGITGRATAFAVPFGKAVGAIRLSGVAETAAIPYVEPAGRLLLRGQAGVSFLNAAGLGLTPLRLSGAARVILRLRGVSGVGRLGLTGTAGVWYPGISILDYEASGPIRVSGTAVGQPGFVASTAGGFTLSGVAIVAPNFLVVEAGGGITATGQAVTAADYLPVIGGGVMVIGTAGLQSQVLHSAAGALSLSGAVGPAIGYRATSQGRLALDGRVILYGAVVPVTGGAIIVRGVSGAPGGTAFFPTYEPSGAWRLSGINGLQAHYAFQGSGSLGGVFGAAEGQDSAYSLVDYGSVQQRSCDPDIDERAFLSMVVRSEPIWDTLNMAGLDGWKLICFNRKTREGTIRYDDKTYVVRVPDINARHTERNLPPAPVPQPNLAGQGEGAGQRRCDTVSQQMALAFIPAGHHLHALLSGLPADQWEVLCWDRRTRRLELRVQSRRLAITVPESSGPAESSSPLPTVIEPTNARNYGSGLVSGITQDGLLRLIQNDRLRQTLSGLGKDDWAVTAFDRRTRKAELRVQGRHLTVTV